MMASILVPVRRKVGRQVERTISHYITRRSGGLRADTSLLFFSGRELCCPVNILMAALARAGVTGFRGISGRIRSMVAPHASLLSFAAAPSRHSAAIRRILPYVLRYRMHIIGATLALLAATVTVLRLGQGLRR